jgi:hypothetical protein
MQVAARRICSYYVLLASTVAMQPLIVPLSVLDIAASTLYRVVHTLQQELRIGRCVLPAGIAPTESVIVLVYVPQDTPQMAALRPPIMMRQRIAIIARRDTTRLEALLRAVNPRIV